VIAKGRGRKSWLPEGTVAEVVRVTLEETPDDTSTHCGLCLKRPCDFRIALAAPAHRERHRPRRHRHRLSRGMVRDNPEMNKRVAAMTALGRVGLPDDDGGAVSMLLSSGERLDHRSADRGLRRDGTLSPSRATSRCRKQSTR
jgi:hypothetical protein